MKLLREGKFRYEEYTLTFDKNARDRYEDKESFLKDATAFIKGKKFVRTSQVQRKFKTGYTRTAELIAALEKKGLIGPYENGRYKIL